MIETPNRRKSCRKSLADTFKDAGVRREDLTKEIEEPLTPDEEYLAVSD